MDPKKELVARLTEAKLSADPREILDRKFLFFTTHDSHHEILIGTITGIHISDEDGLELYITTPPVRGERLNRLRYLGSSWALLCPSLNFREAFHVGDFEFLEGDWPMNFV